MVVTAAPVSLHDRLAAAGVLAALLAWYAYTRFYWSVAGLHGALPPCPFLLLTGVPCPFCGVTRSFASIWQGDLGRALHFHPLGPLYFGAGLVAVAVAGWAVLSGRLLRVHLSQRVERAGYLAAAALVMGGWLLKQLT